MSKSREPKWIQLLDRWAMRVAVFMCVACLLAVLLNKADAMPHDRYTVPGDECPAWVLLANEGTCGGES